MLQITGNNFKECVCKRAAVNLSHGLPARSLHDGCRTLSAVIRTAQTFLAARRALAVLVLAHVLAVLALAASPRLHHWVHPDEDGDDGDCAVVWLLHGSGGDAAPGPCALPVLFGLELTARSATALPAVFVPAVFAGSRVFEHAPPRVG